LRGQHTVNESLRQHLAEVTRSLAERAAVVQVEEQARQAALKQLEAARALEHAKLRDVAEAKAQELAAMQQNLRLQMEELKVQVETLRAALAAKETELDKTRELIKQQQAQ
jgi:hypothetical protein